MSVPDKYLDEPDTCLCDEHGKPQPCDYCRVDRLMQQAEEYDERESQP